MEAKTELAEVLKRRFGVKGKQITWLRGVDRSVVARVGVLHFRLRARHLEVWSGRAWVEAHDLRELGYVLADAAALSEPPNLEA